jgi:hypothetical protein
MPHSEKDQEIEMLRAEVEMLMKERDCLLRVAGAAAGFVANMDIRALPKSTYEAADFLAQCVNGIPEDTLTDALASVRAEVALDVPERRRTPRDPK